MRWGLALLHTAPAWDICMACGLCVQTDARSAAGAPHSLLRCLLCWLHSQGERLPGCDMVSYGPTILGAHSPDERLDVATVGPFWEATLRLMRELAKP